jgi:holo-[acyl-carrier protein] synthase
VTVLGVGVDLVHVPAFAEQLADPASGFVEATFTAAERRTAEREPLRRPERLAARFAAKEAFVKAWSAARAGRAPALASVDLREIEVADDGYGRPLLRLHGAVAAELERLGGPGAHVSLSHDGPATCAVVVLSAPVPGRPR